MGFALAVLLVTWALTQLVDLLQASWPLLVGVVIVVGLAVFGVAIWRRRDYW